MIENFQSNSWITINQIRVWKQCNRGYQQLFY